MFYFQVPKCSRNALQTLLADVFVKNTDIRTYKNGEVRGGGATGTSPTLNYTKLHTPNTDTQLPRQIHTPIHIN